MAISDNKITNAEIAEVHVQAAPDTLTGSAQQNKAVFDAYSDLIKEKHNSLIDDIDGEYASNWRNGSQTGSVRTTGSEEEGDYYTIGQYATAEGRQTKASESNSHAEGFRTQARGDTSHAEGYFATADGNNSHAEGRETIASGKNSHAEGLFANASGDNSHAEGNSAEASGNNSHAEGYGTIASSSDQHVSGRYNIEDTNNIYAEIIGNGTSLGRGNGRTLDWNGNEVLAGKLTVGTEPVNNKDVATKGYVDTGLAGKVDKVTGKGLSTEDYTTAEKAKLSNIEAGAEVNVQADWNQENNTYDAYIQNKPAIKAGTGNKAVKENSATTASGSNSHAEGNSTEASGDNSHAEGDSTEASGLYAHAEGTTTLATGTGSHTEGYLTKAAESYTHANGVGTEAHGYAETVIGTYNDYDAMNEPYAFVIGNGYEDGDRSNAHTTDWNGNAWYAGNVTDGTGNVLSEKVDKETGKGLSTEDYTTAEKTKLSGIEAGAEANAQSDWNQSDSGADDYIKNKPTLPTKTSDLTNDSDYTTKQYVDGKLPIGKASGSIASVKDGADGMPIKSLTATIVPKQSGSGTPSPDNIRPISGWTEVTVFVSPTEDEEDATTHTTSLGRTVYGGDAEIVSGSLTDKMAMVDLGTLNWSEEVDGVYSTRALVGQIKEPLTTTEVPNVLCSHYASASYIQLWAQQLDGSITVIWSASGAHGEIWVRDSRFTDAASFKTAMSGVQLVYELAEPQTYQLTPQQINTLSGVNNVWADSGNVTIEYVRDIGLALDNLLPDSPTTDGTYTLVCTVSDGKATIAWQSSGASLSSPLSMSSPASLNINTTEEEGDSNEIR